MQVSNSLNPVYGTQNSSQKSSAPLSASSFLESLGKEIAAIFESLSEGLDEDVKFKRAMSLSLNMSSPMFMRFDSVGYPDGMPSDVKFAMQEQSGAYKALDNEVDKNTFKIDWMINHIVHEQSSDPEFGNFLRDLRKEYSGEALSDYESRDQANEDDYALQKFKDDLTTKGAAKFLHDFNSEKIEKMVEKYKAELLKEMEKNPDLNLDIEKMVSDYRKQLLERLAQLEDEGEKSTLNIHRMEMEILSKFDVNLEKLLQETA
jgi:hypothetical protein